MLYKDIEKSYDNYVKTQISQYKNYEYWGIKDGIEYIIIKNNKVAYKTSDLSVKEIMESTTALRLKTEKFSVRKFQKKRLKA